MIETNLKYQAVIFVINEDIIPNAKVIQKLMGEVFDGFDLIPNTFFEVSNLNPQPAARLRFASVNNEWSISFGSNRLDIEKLPVDPKGENLGELKSFCETTVKIIERLFAVFPKKANRLSLVTEGLFKELPEDILYKIYCKLFTPPKILVENKPTEWNFRSVVKLTKSISNKQEEVNFIGGINRVTGSVLNLVNFNTTNFIDKIQLTTDINTSQHDKEFRFDTESVKDFYSNVHLWTEELRKEILNHIQ
jgi:hypothetical protein